jgi:2-dehydropantoate 2-reductase
MRRRPPEGVLPFREENVGMRIAVFGTGGVGGYFGGRLAQAGEEVVFIARGAHLEAIQRDGLTVESVEGDFVVRPSKATNDPRAGGPVDVVLVAVKAWQVRDAGRELRPLVEGGSFVVPLQNGVEAADELAAELGGERVVGGLCKILSYVAGPGRIRHAGVAPRIEFGERDGRRSERVDRLRAAFENAAGVSVGTPEDIVVALWEKFLFIAPLSGVGAVTRMPAGVLRSVPEGREMLESAMKEVFDLARARGIGLRKDAVARTMSYVDSLPADGTASMQRDILEGRPSELDYQTGAIVRLGREARVPVPVNEFIYRALLPGERRARGAA